MFVHKLVSYLLVDLLWEIVLIVGGFVESKFFRVFLQCSFCDVYYKYCRTPMPKALMNILEEGLDLYNRHTRKHGR